MPSIVQFIHPGPEHEPDNPPLDNHKNWNIGDHRRKFLRSNGDYVQNGSVYKGELMFWGEWEPPSNVQSLNQMGNRLNPRWLHRPYLPVPIPIATGLQNTDPFIFEDEFKYLLCRQFRQKPKLNATQLAHLEKGSLILFGSGINTKKPNAFFQLDTVFVVSGCIPYNPLTAPLVPPAITPNYFDVVYSKAYSGVLPNVDLRLYHSATFNNQVNGMYSFVPSQLFNGIMVGFPRVGLRNLPYLTNKLSQSFRITKNLTLSQIQNFWSVIVNESRMQGCVEGVKFY